jgi:hypothetical protein
MANISSNKLGVFLIEPGSTSPLEVLKSTTTAFTGVDDAALDAAGLVNEDYAYVLSSTGAFLGLGEVQVVSGGTDLEIVASNDTPVVLAAATSTSLEASNTINEVAARDGSGSSKNFIASGALSWNVSVDGLLDISGATGSAVSLTDAAAAQKYVHVEFDTDVSTGNDQSTVKYVGQALIGSVTLSGGVDDIATYSATLQGYGDLYKVV